MKSSGTLGRLLLASAIMYAAQGATSGGYTDTFGGYRPKTGCRLYRKSATPVAVDRRQAKRKRNKLKQR